jgi:hypothetical protein
MAESTPESGPVLPGDLVPAAAEPTDGAGAAALTDAG